MQAPEPPGPLRLASVPSVPVRPPAVLAAERQRPRPGCRLLPEPPRKPPSVPRRSCHSDCWPLAGGARASGRGSGRALAPAHRAAPAPCSLVTWSLSLILQCTAETPRRLAGLWDPLFGAPRFPGKVSASTPGPWPSRSSLRVPGLGHRSCLVDVQVHAGSIAEVCLRPCGGGVGVREGSSSGQVSWWPWARWKEARLIFTVLASSGLMPRAS